MQAIIITGLVSGIVHGAARLLGGTGRYSTDFRAVAYATPAYAVVMGLSSLLPPAVALLSLPLLLIASGWVAWSLAQAVGAHHRLAPPRAWVAALAPLVVLPSGFCALYYVVAF